MMNENIQDDKKSEVEIIIQKNEEISFYTCETLKVNPLVCQFDVHVVLSLPEEPLANTYYVLRRENQWDFYYVDNFLNYIAYTTVQEELIKLAQRMDKIMQMNLVATLTEVLEKQLVTKLTKDEIEQIKKLFEHDEWEVSFVNSVLKIIKNNSENENTSKLINKIQQQSMQTLSKELEEKIKKTFKQIIIENAYRNAGSYVGIGQCNIDDKLLFSQDFGPCQIVIALLKNRKYILYHALLLNETNAFKRFIKMAENNCDCIYIRSYALTRA